MGNPDSACEIWQYLASLPSEAYAPAVCDHGMQMEDYDDCDLAWAQATLEDPTADAEAYADALTIIEYLQGEMFDCVHETLRDAIACDMGECVWDTPPA